MSSFWRGRPGEGGQAVVLMALAMVVLLMGIGLAIDTGQLYVARRTIQEAADSSAYAGAVVLYQGGTAEQASAAAVSDAARNGYVDGANGGLVTVTVNIPPTSGPHASDSRHVEVSISDQVRTSLVPAQGQLNLVSARAVAGAEALNNGFAIMALDRGDTANAIQVGASGSLSVTGASILVNSTSANAATNYGGSVSVTPTPTYGTEAAGNLQGAWPNPSTGTTQQPDPFAGYPTPSTTGMTTHSAMPNGNPTITVDPGIWTVEISASGGETIELRSGVYILRAGMGGTGNANFTNASGGVFIFNTTADYPNGSSGGCSSLRLTGNATSSLSPMTTGAYAGLLIYQDPACAATMTITGNGSATASGTIYLPNAQFVLNGNNATLTGSQLVAKTIDIQNGSISVAFAAGTTAQPVLPRLSE